MSYRQEITVDPLIRDFTPDQKALRLRILEILHEAKSSHIGSCLSVADLINSVYAVKQPKDIFVLSNGHAAVAWYTVLEQVGLLKDASMTYLGVHPDRNPHIGIEVSTGSLGQGLPIAAGLALADRQRRLYCLTSDGELMEGSMWETLRLVRELNLRNLSIIVSANGWGAYGAIDPAALRRQIEGFGFRVVTVNGHDPYDIHTALTAPITDLSVIFAATRSDQLPFLTGFDAHYYVMTEADYRLAVELLQ